MVDKVLLKEIVNEFSITDRNEYDERVLLQHIDDLMASIPDKRRSSYGIVSLVATLCKTLYEQMGEDSFDIGRFIYEESHDYRAIVVGLGLISHYGVKNPNIVLPILKEVSDHSQWEVKEFVQMFIRKITKSNKALVQKYLIDMTQSENPNHRRFASECLRPVVENRWIHDEPEYSLKVLRNLFNESNKFPRVSVGNNLSDLSRKNPELIYHIVQELIEMDNSNSYFIAYRACRNLVKQDPIRVMKLLNTDCYEYKNKRYYRDDYL